MADILVPVMVVGMLFVALPWLVLHYVTRWKTAATLTNDDERMLGDMHELARRLEDRLETVERLVAQENPEWQPRRIDLDTSDFDPENVRKLKRNR
ncbi:envelope stress response membrane protein PspB [Sphingorhabdus sp.]|uniref:envelope stress response membrane protein PspB n=1 Tax=Sphingorhabdus sp. TaxID=1902408 RepID=UPI003342ACEB